GVSWLGGFGDLTVTNPRPVETVNIVYNEGGKSNSLLYKKVDDWDKVARGVWWGGKDWTGIEDRYFAAAFLPEANTAAGKLETRWGMVGLGEKMGEKPRRNQLVQISTATISPPALLFFVGQKDYARQKKMTPPLHSLVNFGWLEFISDPLFHGMKWLQKY